MILARYLLSQFFSPFLFGLALFSGVLILEKLFDVMDLLINKGVSLFNSLKIFILFFPTVLSLTIPMSILLACLLTFGRLSEDHEITALRASGLSFKQILWPPLLMAGVLSLLLVPFNGIVAPKAMGSFKTLYHDIVSSDPLIKIEPKQFIVMKNIRLYANEVSEDRQLLKNVLLYQFGEENWQRVYAQEGTANIEEDKLYLHLRQGQLEKFSKEKPQDSLHAKFENYTLSVPFMKDKGRRGLGVREMNYTQLREAIQERRKEGNPTAPLEAEFHLRLAVAFAPFSLALLGIPLGITMERGGRGIGFGTSVAVVFFYYLLLIFGLNMAEKQALPALPALWMANAFTIVLGLILYKKRVLR